jgi:beta-glucosidase
MSKYLFPMAALVFTLSACSPKYTLEEKEDHVLVVHQEGARLGYSPESGVSIIEVDRLAFKDLNQNGEMDPYEDWRLPVDERAADLAARMSVEQIAGLMLYSAHQSIPAGSFPGRGGTYGGKSFRESGADPSDLSDQQIAFLTDDNLRHVLVTRVESPEVAARWNNKVQALVEGLGLGIPANNSSDPRHRSTSNAEYNEGAGGQISMWPTTLGLAATFDPALMRKFGEIASIEYRALGIATALSPQIDLATEPRWSRFSGTMGEDPDLATDLARAYVDGFQTSDNDHDIVSGWGYQSVNAMVKHWPGGGPEEGGRDAHFGYGAYAVYPGNKLEDHLAPFVEGAFQLEGPTGMASAVMPYYTISTDVDQTYLLRGTYGYDGVVCTDWRITDDVHSVYEFEGKAWGVETLSKAEKHYKVIEAGVDQFGGNNEMGTVLEAYKMGVEEHGEEYMRTRFEQSAVRLLRNIFHTGLFENPYLDVEESKKTVGNPEFMKAGFEAQLRSIVLLKNGKGILPLDKQMKVWIPRRYVAAASDWFGMPTPEHWEDPFNPEVVRSYFRVVDTPEEADFALVGIESPNGGVGYDVKDRESGGNGYVPIPLQYGEYKAVYARKTSLAGGSPFEEFTNRTYQGKTFTAYNRSDLDLLRETKKKMAGKPVILVINLIKPTVMAEVEPLADGILVHMGVQDQALMEVVSGAFEPSGLLPFQMPSGMKTVEEQFEDVPRDMECYTDSENHSYDFAFGLNWQGVIEDERVARYK